MRTREAWGLQRLRGAGVVCSDCEPGAQRLRGPWSCNKAGGLQRGRLGCSSASAFLGQHLWGDTWGYTKFPHSPRTRAATSPRTRSSSSPRHRHFVAASSPRLRGVVVESSSSSRRCRHSSSLLVAVVIASSCHPSRLQRLRGHVGAAASCRACEGSWALQRLCLGTESTDSTV